jgi:hypothetical protein
MEGVPKLEFDRRVPYDQYVHASTLHSLHGGPPDHRRQAGQRRLGRHSLVA